MKYNVIYQIIDLHSGKFLIGSTNDIFRRCREHRCDLRHNRHGNSHLQNIYNKYGKNNLYFAIIEIVKDNNQLLEREQFFINKFWGNKYLLNQNPFAAKPKSRLGIFLTQEHKNKISQSKKNKPIRYWLNKQRSHETKIKISKSKNKNEYIVLQHIETGKIIKGYGITIVAKSLNINRGNLRQVIDGKRKSCGGYQLCKI